MSKLVCKNCRSVDVEYEDYIGGTSYYICLTCGARGSEEKFTPKTIFDQITQSPEVLAETLVYSITCYCSVGAVKHWYSALELGTYFSKREEALAATIEKLKEVCNG